MGQLFDSPIFDIVISVINAIFLLFCYSKMGIDPWAAIIPIYGPWCLYDCVLGYGWLSLLSIISILVAFSGSPIAFIIAIVAAVLEIVVYWKMFKGFGKSTLFCIFGVIFTPIAIAICAFDKSTYCG